MKQLLFIFTILFLLILFTSCEKPDEEAPTVTILTLQENDVVYEIVTISCIATDNEAVEKVELWLDGEYSGISDKTEPYKLEWNTTVYENRTYIVTVRVHDINGNKADSDPITIIVDNSLALPQSVSIISIVYANGSFTITWNESTDDDFGSYELEKSVESTMGDYAVIYTTDEVANTTFVDTDIDPLLFQYYRITVIDIFGYETKGQIVSSSLDPIPTSVNVTSVTYTLAEMTVEWDKSTDTDFKHYKLLYSEMENGNKTIVDTYTDVNTTSYTTTDFNPTHENWFWVEVEDSLGQSSFGGGSTNLIDSPPSPSTIYPINYQNHSFPIKWSKNSDDDFSKYILYESITDNFNDAVIVFESETVTDTTFAVSGIQYDEFRYYWIVILDYWHLQNKNPSVRGSSYAKIVYNTIINGAQQLVTMDIDGVNKQVLTDSENHCQFPMFLPSGLKIVFVSYGEGYSNIGIVNVDGTNFREITTGNNSYYAFPHFSPDEQWIYYGNEGEIYRIDVNGNNLTNITNNEREDGFSPLTNHFTTDGNSIVYSSKGNDNREIYKMDLVGTNQINLTNNNGRNSHPKISSNNKITFMSDGDVFVMDIDGNDQINISNTSTTSENGPTFSPDGQKVAYESSGKLYEVDIDGTNQRLIANLGDSISYPVYYPGGGKIICEVYFQYSGNEVYIVNTDGSGIMDLTNNPNISDGHPQIQPQP